MRSVTRNKIENVTYTFERVKKPNSLVIFVVFEFKICFTFLHGQNIERSTSFASHENNMNCTIIYDNKV